MHLTENDLRELGDASEQLSRAALKARTLNVRGATAAEDWSGKYTASLHPEIVKGLEGARRVLADQGIELAVSERAMREIDCDQHEQQVTIARISVDVGAATKAWVELLFWPRSEEQKVGVIVRDDESTETLEVLEQLSIESKELIRWINLAIRQLADNCKQLANIEEDHPF